MPTRRRPPQTALLEEVDGNMMATMMAPLVGHSVVGHYSIESEESSDT